MMMIAHVATLTETTAIITVQRPCNESLPFHSNLVNSTNVSCTWKCKEGYFRTNPLSGKSTCRKCSDENSTMLSCGLGFRLKQCADASDTSCTLCPPKTNIPGIESYLHPGDCETTVCNPGFTKEAAFNEFTKQECKICPKDYYCLGGYEDLKKGIQKKFPCLDNCTTGDKQGVLSPFGCFAKDDGFGIYSVLALEYTIFISSSYTSFIEFPLNGRCFTLDNIVYRNLDYGTFLKCTLESTTIPSFARSTCLVIISQCIDINQYKIWLKAKYDNIFKTEIVPGIKTCLKTDENIANFVRISSGFINEHSKIPGSIYSEAIVTYDDELKWASPPENVPSLQTDLLPWYKNNKIVYELFGAFYVVIMCSIFACCIACGMVCIMRQKKKVAQKLYQDMEKQQKRISKNMKT